MLDNLHWLAELFTWFVRKRELPPGGELEVDAAGWVHGPSVTRRPAHRSWHYADLKPHGGRPLGACWHYTATAPGTALSMAKRRQRKRRPERDRAASWHFSIETDGAVVQMVSTLAGAWHCARGEVSGYPVNRCLLGIELVGHGADYPDAQVEAAGRLLEALCDAYHWQAAHCRHEHRDFDPKRRSDCGPPWTDQHLPAVLVMAGVAAKD